jgi:ATP-dependent helicase/nuclease subunit A
MSAPGRQPADHADRERVRTDLAHCCIVEAAAGTGKTTELVARIVNVLATGHRGATIDKIVAVTFTEKAAGELKLRLREELERKRQAATGEPRARLEAALQFLEEARVSTIHGFCADLLRERPVEARVDPQFQVLTEDQAARLYDLAFDGWLQDQLRDPGEGVRRSLRRPARKNFGTEPDEDGPIERLRRAGRALVDWRDHPARWRRDPFDREGDIRRHVDALMAFVEMSAGPSWDRDPLYLDTTRARTGAAAIAAGLVPAGDLDGLEALLVDLHHDRGFARPRKGSAAGYSRRHTRAAVWDSRQALYERLGDFERRANADLAAALQGDLQDSLARYAALKAAEGAVDFVDLLLEARTLLRDNAEVRRTFRARITHLFVDEFQDTDPLQAEILVLLAGAPDQDLVSPVDWRAVTPRPGSLFIVGDPKQSIYRFRRADIGTYQDVCEWLRRQGAARAEHQFPRDAGHPARRQRGLRAADDRRPGDPGAAVRPADVLAGRGKPAAGVGGAAGAAAVRRAQRHEEGDRRVAARRGRRVPGVALRFERLADHRARPAVRRAGARADPAPPCLPAVPAVHQLQ